MTPWCCCCQLCHNAVQFRGGAWFEVQDYTQWKSCYITPKDMLWNHKASMLLHPFLAAVWLISTNHTLPPCHEACCVRYRLILEGSSLPLQSETCCTCCDNFVVCRMAVTHMHTQFHLRPQALVAVWCTVILLLTPGSYTSHNV